MSEFLSSVDARIGVTCNAGCPPIYIACTSWIRGFVSRWALTSAKSICQRATNPAKAQFRGFKHKTAPFVRIGNSLSVRFLPHLPPHETPVSDRSTDFAAIPAAHRNLSDTARQRARIATMALFFIAGMVYGSWGVRIADRARPLPPESRLAVARALSRLPAARSARWPRTRRGLRASARAAPASPAGS